MPDFRVQFYLASNPDSSSPINICNFSVSNHLIGTFGDLYSGTLINHLNELFEPYTNPNSSRTPFTSYYTTGGIKVGRIEMQDEKHKAAAVSGNIGEAIIIPAFSVALSKAMNRVPFHRIKANKMKCPDYRIALSSTEINRLWSKSDLAPIPTFISDYPLEVKSTLSKDNYYPVEALKQLNAYWEECPDINQGNGIIARVNLGYPISNIRFYLFVKNHKFNMKRFKSFLNVNVQKKHGKSKQQRLCESIGGLFI